MRKHKALLLLGGNLGNVEQRFREVTTALTQVGVILNQSRMYKTAAWGMDNAPDFLNQALILETSKDPVNLLRFLKELEGDVVKRIADQAYASRELDIDILLMDDMQIETEEITIPHGKMHLRNFCLVPAAEIAGEWEHPVFDSSLAILLDQSTDPLKVWPHE